MELQGIKQDEETEIYRTEALEIAFRQEQELQSKKLLTQIKSKYYMLKVNYPKLAEQIDNEPLILDEEFVRKEEPRENKL